MQDSVNHFQNTDFWIFKLFWSVTRKNTLSAIEILLFYIQFILINIFCLNCCNGQCHIIFKLYHRASIVVRTIILRHSPDPDRLLRSLSQHSHSHNHNQKQKSPHALSHINLRSCRFLFRHGSRIFHKRHPQYRTLRKFYQFNLHQIKMLFNVCDIFYQRPSEFYFIIFDRFGPNSRMSLPEVVRTKRTGFCIDIFDFYSHNRTIDFFDRWANITQFGMGSRFMLQFIFTASSRFYHVLYKFQFILFGYIGN